MAKAKLQFKAHILRSFESLSEDLDAIADSATTNLVKQTGDWTDGDRGPSDQMIKNLRGISQEISMMVLDLSNVADKLHEGLAMYDEGAILDAADSCADIAKSGKVLTKHTKQLGKNIRFNKKHEERMGY